ncbi:hypothetical protein XA68_10227 [Ophiocordyceps unilateralis]|uniref:Uncharacterized protein n=1 Tax=Ophiocordyceps unilateralis TaxID=268505 RepID=A0A2A9NZV1_OPHUN|nr:hypothetical protein XA68_10227 [Ophiocordyceps unilateralis]
MVDETAAQASRYRVYVGSSGNSAAAISYKSTSALASTRRGFMTSSIVYQHRIEITAFGLSAQASVVCHDIVCHPRVLFFRP